MGQVQKERHGDKIRRLLQVKDGGKQAWDSLRNRRQSVGAKMKNREIDAAEDYLERCAQVVVTIDLVESLQRPENLEVSLRYVLKHATHGGSNIFQLSDTAEKPNHLVANRRRW